VFHHAAYAGNDSFTEYLVRKANEAVTKDDKKKMGDLLSAPDASESSAIQFAAKNRKKGVVAILLGATKQVDTDGEDRGVSDDVRLYNLELNKT
jgi:hypothetical protein